MNLLNNVELVMWTPAPNSVPPRVGDVQYYLEREGFSGSYAHPVGDTTAFRRAVHAKEQPDIKATFWKDGETVRAQLEQLAPEGELLRREFVAAFNSGMTAEVCLHEFLGVYTWSDVTKILQEIFEKEAAGAYSPKKSGGVYFVPGANKAVLDRLERATADFGLRLLRFGVPDTSVQRDEIAIAIHGAIEDEIAAHAEAIGRYDTTTKLHVLQERQERLRVTLAQIDRLAEHLNGRAQPLRDGIDQAERALIKLVSEQQAAPLEKRGGRRLVLS